MITSPVINTLKASWNVIRQLKQELQHRTLFLKSDETSGLIAKDRSNNDYDAHYIGSRPENQIWVGEKSATLDGDYFEIPAAPINNHGDFTFCGWVKTTSPNFTLLSCKRGS